MRFRPALSLLGTSMLPLLCLVTIPAPAQESLNLAPNVDLTAGRDGPAGWAVARGRGSVADGNALRIDGTGHDAEFWRSKPVQFQAGRTYRFETRARRLGGAGSIIAGPEFANRDYTISTGDWRTIGHVFRVPDNVKTGSLRLGVWESSGAVEFDSVRVVPVQPVYQASGGLRLGTGESVRNGRYTFSGSFGQEGSNDHRPLLKASAGFNSDRWTLGEGDHVVYRFGLPAHPFSSAKLTVNVNHRVGGSCVVEVSPDGRSWRNVATLNRVGSATSELARDLFPSKALFVRVRADGRNASFQVNEVSLDATIAGHAPDLIGKTTYAEVTESAPSLALRGLAFDAASPGAKTLEIAMENKGGASLSVRAECESRPSGGTAAARGFPGAKPVALAARSKGVVKLALPSAAPGRNDLALRLLGNGKAMVALTLPYVVPDFGREDYGERIAGVDGRASVWWCDATHKIPRDRGAPAIEGSAAVFSAARNDHEAVQVVVRPAAALKNLTATLAGLSGPGGAKIPPSNTHVFREYYHFVDRPTDSTGSRGWWPDALPPFSRPIDVAAGVNQPLWVLVDVPGDAVPGDYSGKLTLKADGWAAEVPLRLHVWKFTLPVRNHVETAFGFYPHLVYRYHNIQTEADKRKILDLYFQNFAAHRISPYDPTPLDPIRATFHGEADPPRVDLDWSAFDAAMEHALKTYHFTNFQLHLQGMGGGTYASRVEPSIGRYREGSPQYEALFSSYLRQISDHLRAKGWLKNSYVYWFDEPEPKDYAFVRSGMARIKKYGPEIPRMLTEEPGPDLTGSVDIWCPLTPNYNFAQAETLRKRGDRFWWYVCTGPKAPYCTLFIDHPATELRVWLWQNWRYKVGGNLVWSTTWWTSPAAFPDTSQNPYEDPMSYTDGHGLPRGTRAYWGNGDGRFLYPPEAAATPGRAGGKPVLEPPVSSLRWEMLREGIEDYEFLYLLRDLLARRRADLDDATVKRIEGLLEVPQSISRDMTTFTTDPAPIYARRAEIAKAIETLGGN